MSILFAFMSIACSVMSSFFASQGEFKAAAMGVFLAIVYMVIAFHGFKRGQ